MRRNAQDWCGNGDRVPRGAVARVGEGAGQEAGINRNGEMSVFSWPLRPAEKPGRKWNSSWLLPPHGHESASTHSWLRSSLGAKPRGNCKKRPPRPPFIVVYEFLIVK